MPRRRPIYWRTADVSAWGAHQRATGRYIGGAGMNAPPTEDRFWSLNFIIGGGRDELARIDGRISLLIYMIRHSGLYSDYNIALFDDAIYRMGKLCVRWVVTYTQVRMALKRLYHS
jgi:hypothetical protein